MPHPHLALILVLVFAPAAAAQNVVIPDVPAEPLFSTVDVRDLPRSTSNVPTPTPLPNPDQDVALAPPLVNVEGIPFTASSPPAPVGAVGPHHYVQVANHWRGSVFSIYDKRGALLIEPTHMKLLVGSNICGLGGVQPMVVYDRDADRWLLSEVSIINVLGLKLSHFCVYVSRTGDPISGGWMLYELITTFVPDFPRYGIWPDAYYVSTNEGFPTLYAFPRRAMLAGEPVSHQRVVAPRLAGFPFQAFTPADRDGATPPPADSPGIFIRHRDDEAHDPFPDPTRDFLEIFTLRPDFENPDQTVLSGPFSIAIAEFDSDLCGLEQFFCFAQPGTSVTLDPLREVVNWRLQYRNFESHETLVGNFTTDVDGTDRGGVRWFELRRTGKGAWKLFQEGLVASDDANRWVGSIAMDGDGNLALGYSIGSSEISPSLRYTGRGATDPLGIMSVPEQTLVDGSGAQFNFSRWGDHSSMNIDPTDDCTFWYTGEYWSSPTGFVWTTRIGAFRFKSCGSEPPVAVARADTPVECSSPDGAIVVLDGSLSSDVNDGIAAFHWRLNDDEGTRLGSGEILSALLPLGTSSVSLIVEDFEGQTATDSLRIEVVDTTAPRLRVRLVPAVLWPPNGRMVDVRARIRVRDACSPTNVALESVASNQPDDGDLRGVELGTADTRFSVRAERARGRRRVYTATYAATDSAGNLTRASGESVVPKNRPRPVPLLLRWWRLLLWLLGL